MIDSTAAVRELVLLYAPLSTLLGAERIYQGRLPAGFTPSQGAIVYFCRGGESERDLPLIQPSYQFSCWHENPLKARELYRALHDSLWDRALVSLPTTGAVFLAAEEEQHGQEIIDPETGWTSVVSFWRLIFRKG